MAPELMENRRAEIGKKEYQFLISEKGQKRLVLLHGLGADKAAMEEMCRPLPEEFDCLIPDLPGHNGVGSEGIREPADYAAYLKVLLDELGWSEFGIMGFSLGGLIGIELAKLYPNERLQLAVWASPIGHSGLTGRCKMLMVINRAAPRWLFRWLCSGRYTPFLGGLFGIRLNPKYWDALKRFDNRSVLGIDFSRKREIRGINSGRPALVIYGDSDGFVRPDKKKISEDKLEENIRVEIISGGGHFSSVRGQAEAIRQIADFMGE